MKIKPRDGQRIKRGIESVERLARVSTAAGALVAAGKPFFGGIAYAAEEIGAATFDDETGELTPSSGEVTLLRLADAADRFNENPWAPADPPATITAYNIALNPVQPKVPLMYVWVEGRAVIIFESCPAVET